MADLDIAKLRADILDRMDNSVLIERLTEGVRTKLRSKTRVTRAINQAFLTFVQGADTGRIPKLVSIVSPSADTDVGDNGVSDGIKTYKWPENAFFEREMGGVTKIILNGSEYNVNEDDAVKIESLRYYVNSPFFESDYEAYAIDLAMKRIYTPEDVTLQTRIVEEPEQVADDDTYGSDSAATLPVSESFFNNIAQQGFQELVNMAANVGGTPDESARSKQARREQREREQEAAQQQG